jgi:CRISPR system Cascade subunit CasD
MPRTHPGTTVLALRLAGPLQSWGDRSAFNRRETRPQPTKSGVLGLLAAAAGRPREHPLDDLIALRLGVRVDQPGTILRDYHTVSDHRGRPLPQSGVTAKGAQKPTSPAKYTHVTQRFYLQDAVFVAAVTGDEALIDSLAHAVTNPAFPLALGRRACVPTQPISLGLHKGDLKEVLTTLSWQVSKYAQGKHGSRHGNPSHIRLPVTLEADDGDDIQHDVPLSFDPRGRQFTSRRVRHDWVSVPTGFPASSADGGGHDPFALLGW